MIDNSEWNFNMLETMIGILSGKFNNEILQLNLLLFNEKWINENEIEDFGNEIFDRNNPFS